MGAIVGTRRVSGGVLHLRSIQLSEAAAASAAGKGSEGLKRNEEGVGGMKSILKGSARGERSRFFPLFDFN